MLGKIAAFEFKYQAKSPLFLVTFVLLFLLAFGAVTSDNIQLGGVGNVNVNSPFALTQTTIIFTQIGMFIVAAFLATAVIRDFDLRTAELFFTTPITKHEYVFGRFLGAFAVSVLLLLAAPFGTMFGTLMPWLDPERIGPFSLWYYIQPFLVFGVTGMLFSGAYAFGLAVLTRSIAGTYVGIVVLFIILGVTGSVLGNLEYRTLSALLDPFGGGAFQEITRYWTAIERNEQLVAPSGFVLINRLIWLVVAVFILGLAYLRFGFSLTMARRGQKPKPDAADETTETAPTVALETWVVRPRFSVMTQWRQFLTRTAFETKTVLKGAPFLILMAFALIITGFSFYAGIEQILGTPVYPVTRVLTNVMRGTMTLSLLIVIIYFSAELVWRERDLRLHAVVDAAPVPGWVFAASKMVAMTLVIAALLFSGVVGGVIFQLVNGFTKFDFDVYLTRHMLDYGQLFYVAGILGVFVQTLVRNKYMGMGVMVLFVISLFVLTPMGYEDPLYQIGGRADIGYSDMNGWGYFAVIALSYAAYWGFFCLILFVGVHLLWPRGGTEPLRLRLRQAPANLSPAISVLAIIAIAGFLGTGGYIYYNTHILNTYVTQDDIERQQIAYEKRYMANEDLPQPRIVAIAADVDLFSDERRYEARGTYTLENRTGQDIETVFVGFNPEAEIHAVTLDGLQPSAVDRDFNYYTFTLTSPMTAGARLPLRFETARHNRGFKHNRNTQGALNGGSATILQNGSVIYGNDAMPYIGFTRAYIITDRNDRRKYELPDIDRAADLDDMEAARNSYLSQDSDWLDFKTTVSTDVEETVIAPGRPLREWTEDGRRYVTYDMSAPMQQLFVYLSADYTRRHDDWNGVSLDVFYHHEHNYNIDKMIHTMKVSLDYFSAHFSPYQYRQMRIMEFPSFIGTFAQSFANTILWSEGLGFIARVEDPTEIDYVFYVGAHEMAHQWWGHQVSSANVQGQTVLVETLAQYSALMVMEHEFGPHLMRRFLKYELDNYLSGRGSETREELPLYRVENQPYIHYRKGSLVMYALKDYLGEDRVNTALSNLIDDVAYQYDPYPRSVDLLRHLDAVAESDDERSLINDLFRQITLWDLELGEATVAERPDGRFDVTITYSARKLVADGEGRERETELDMPIDIGLFAMDPDEKGFGSDAVLHLEKHRVTAGESTITIIVEEPPAYAGIDPYNKLIDRNLDDNLKPVDAF